MEHYKYDIANNIIAIASIRLKHDLDQSDDQLFRNYFENTLAPSFKKQYGVEIKYGKYDEIINQAKKVLS